MKRFFLIFLVALAFYGHAQQKVKVNPNVGLTFSKLTQGASNTIRASYIAGFDLRFGKTVNFVPGLYFGNVGTDVDYTENSISYQFDNSINTLQLRTLLALNIVNTKVFRIRAMGGPSLHWTLQSDEIKKENFNNAIAYFNFGGGLDFGILTLDLRYEYGLTYVFNESGPETIQLDTKNNILILTVGLVF